jgi:hypothetical protein
MKSAGLDDEIQHSGSHLALCQSSDLITGMAYLAVHTNMR